MTPSASAPPFLHTFVLVDDDRWLQAWPACEHMIPVLCEKTLTSVMLPPASYEVTIALSNNQDIHTLNRTFRAQDKPTNVLAFPQHEALPVVIESTPSTPFALGDIITAYETLAHEAEEQGKSFVNHASHMVVHGVLHVLGYDHKTPEQAAVMEALEIRILKTFNIANPYDASSS